MICSLCRFPRPHTKADEAAHARLAKRLEPTIYRMLRVRELQEMGLEMEVAIGLTEIELRSVLPRPMVAALINVLVRKTR